jgi:hypothetical protein
VAECINDAANELRDQLRLRSKIFKAYLITMDESTHVKVTAQVTGFTIVTQILL